VLSSAVAIGTLHAPARFGQMGTDGSVQLNVWVVFLLAIKEQEKQVEMIRQLMTVIQNAALLAAISKATTPAEILDLLRQALAA
jgi:PTS system galactitol-specific IIA component